MLRSERDALRDALAVLEVEHEALRARVAELEAELSDLRPLTVGRRMPIETGLEAANADD